MKKKDKWRPGIFRNTRRDLRREKESQQRLENMYQTIVRTLIRTIDAKDKYTNGHSQRVAKYSLELARRMGKDKAEQSDIYYAALLHDVGKIRIPDTIINKTSRLTEEEYSYIKLHSIAGYHILKDMKDNPLIPIAAKEHHERYDGKGYPNGLQGEGISEVARIIAVADAYDAMTSNRSYRKTMEQSRVRQEIEKGKGAQFDPAIADIMLDMIDEDTEYEMCQKAELNSNILVVDDEPLQHRLIEHTIKDEPGYVLYKAMSGPEALDMMKEQEFDIVLLDIQMPDMDGFAVYEEIRKISDASVVFLTGDSDREKVTRATEMGALDYLVKPFMPQALLEVLHSLLREKEVE